MTEDQPDGGVTDAQLLVQCASMGCGQQYVTSRTSWSMQANRCPVCDTYKAQIVEDDEEPFD